MSILKIYSKDLFYIDIREILIRVGIMEGQKPDFKIPPRTSSRPPKRQSIPERTSSRSRSPEKRGPLSPSKQVPSLEVELNSAKHLAENARKRVKLSTSFDTTYWTARQEYASLEANSTKLLRKFSAAKLKLSDDDFQQTKHGQELILQEQMYEVDTKVFREQAERMQKESHLDILRRSYASLYVGAPTGWGIKNPHGKRSKTEQDKFAAALRAKMDSKHPDPAKEEDWCPITRKYWPRTSITAGHLFPHRSGEAAMDAIFGNSRDEQGVSEMNKPENGIIWATEAEQRFSKGYFVVVPDVPNDASSEEIQKWEGLKVKTYKVRVLPTKDKMMDTKIVSYAGERDIKWRELDDQKLVFRNEWRPRARYLYFTYCEAILRLCFNGQHKEMSKAELRKRYWGTSGRYMLKGALLGFVEQMGHEYEHLLRGASNEDTAPTIDGVVAASDHIKKVAKEDDESEDEDEDEDEEC